MIDIHKIFRPFLVYFRAKRMRDFEMLFQLKNNTKIIDVGGSNFNWQFIKSNPQILLVNLDERYNDLQDENIKFEHGDGTKLKYSDNSFDIAYSNSVIEHLSNFENQKKFSIEIRRVAKKIYMQTPANNFFIEPHLITPFIHWLPLKWQRRLMRNFTLWGIITRPTQEYIDNFLKERRLLSLKEIKALFPNTTIIKEKIFFMTKSYIVIIK